MTSSVPFQDPGREYHEIQASVDAAVRDVVESGNFVLGDVVARFEAAAAGYLGVRHAVGVASGTDALTLVLRGLGIGEGDEVVTSPFTFFATVEAIVHAGARPVFADIRPGTFNLDPEAVAATVTERTAAVLPVHLFGQMAATDTIGAVAERHGLAVVEDAAQAFGAARFAPGGGRDRVMAGTAGGAGCFSFFPTKNLGGWGDGGMVVTDDGYLADRVRRLRVHGEVQRYHHAEVGYNSRLDALQAAVLEAKLPKVDEWNARRRARAAAYDRELDDVDGIRTPVVGEGNHHVYHQYTLRCAERDRVRRSLDGAGIGYGIYYPRPAHLQEPLARAGYGEGDFPEAERAAREVLSLPVFPGLTGEEQGRVLAAVRDA